MQNPRFQSICLLLVVFGILVAGCRGKQPSARENSPSTPQTGQTTKQASQTAQTGQRRASSQKSADSFLADIGERIEQADLSVLFIGNSHSARIPREFSLLNKQLAPDRAVYSKRTPGSGFLANHARLQDTRDLIQAGKWSYVVLQAQKYSQSGKYHYPYDGALELSQLAKDAGARVVMYPEWSRRGVPDEYLRIDKIHHEIAGQTGALVAPIGKAWNLAAKEFPDVAFHAPDGNHASADGNFLTTCVFYGMFAGESPVDPKADAMHQRLAEIAWSLTKDLVPSGEERHP